MSVGDLVSRARESVWGPTSTRIRQSNLRQPAINAYRVMARTVLSGEPPKVFANSIPKAGTHLLTQLLSKTPRLWYSGIHVIDRQFRSDLDEPGDGLGDLDPAAFSRRLKSVRDGQFVTAHVGALPGVTDTLDRFGFTRILMIRDPRDIAVSLAHYYGSSERLHTFEHFGVGMSTVEQRLMATITGIPAVGDNGSIPSIGDRLGKYGAWLADPATLVIRFEDLVGAAGGGTEQAQRDAIRAVLETCRRDSSDDRVTALAHTVFAPHAATFRSGKIGSWQETFSPEHIEAFEQHAPGQLEALGYA